MKHSTQTRMQKVFVLVAVSAMFVAGCELIVDFDRTKIVVEGTPESGGGDALPGTDAPIDTGPGTDAGDAGDGGDGGPPADAADASDAPDGG